MAADQLRFGPLPVTGFSLRAQRDSQGYWSLWLNLSEEGAGYSAHGHEFDRLDVGELVDAVVGTIDAVSRRRHPDLRPLSEPFPA